MLLTRMYFKLRELAQRKWKKDFITDYPCLKYLKVINFKEDRFPVSRNNIILICSLSFYMKVKAGHT